MIRPGCLLLGLALAFVFVHLAFVAVEAMGRVVLSVPVGAFAAMPSAEASLRLLGIVLGLYVTGRLSYRLIDRSGVFPDAL